MKQLLLLLIIIVTPVPALANEVALAAEPISMWSSMLRTAWALLIVIALILCIYGLLRKRFGIGTLQQGNIKVLEIKHIIPRNSLALVEVNNRQFLIGVNASQISLIADFKDEDKVISKKISTDFKAILAREKQ